MKSLRPTFHPSPTLVSVLTLALAASLGCSKLTEPPKPEPFQGETPTTTAASAKAPEAKPRQIKVDVAA